jgi:hypothetical protein
MHAPRTILAGVTVFALLILGIACGKKSAPTAPRPDPPVCSVSPETLSFGSVRVGYGSDLTFSIANTGGGTLSGTLSDTSAAFILLGVTSYSLTHGQYADISVRFAPLREGPQSATISTGSSGCPTVTCVGSTPSVPECQVRASSTDFGTVELESSQERTFTLTNSGGGTLAGTFTSPKADFQVVGNASYSLSVNQSATITVRFTPTRTDTQTCLLNTGSPQCGSILVIGSGTPLAEVDLDFGRVAVGQSAERTFTVYSACGSTLPYAVCTGTPGEAPFRVDGAYPGTPMSYRCDTNYSLLLPYTYTVFFTPQQTGTQRCGITLLCKSVPLQSAFVPFDNVTCRGVGY